MKKYIIGILMLGVLLFALCGCGVYTSGTKAYSQTLHVQVFDLAGKTAYKSETVGTEAAPQSFSYFAGSVPDKHSGEVSMEKAYDYLCGLKTK